jgi:hypothetical protein
MSVGRYDFPIIQGATTVEGFNWYGGGKVCKPIATLTVGCPTTVGITGHGLPAESPTPVYISHVQGATRANTVKNPVHATYIDASSFYLDADTVDQVYKANTGILTYFAPKDITGYTARMHIRENIDDAVELLELTSAAGEITLSVPDARIVVTITAAVTELLTFDEAVYDLELVSNDLVPVVTRLVEGIITLHKEVTRG